MAGEGIVDFPADDLVGFQEDEFGWVAAQLTNRQVTLGAAPVQTPFPAWITRVDNDDQYPYDGLDVDSVVLNQLWVRDVSLTPVVLAPSEAVTTIAGASPTVQFTLAPTEGAVVIAGATPALQISIGPTSGSVVFSGAAPALSVLLSPSSGAVVFTGEVPGVAQTSSGTTLAPSSGAVIISGVVPALATSLLPSSGSVIISGAAPALSLSMTPSSGVVVFTGEVPAVAQAGGSTITIAPTDGQVVVTGGTPALEQLAGRRPRHHRLQPIRDGLAPRLSAKVTTNVAAQKPTGVVARVTLKLPVRTPTLRCAAKAQATLWRPTGGCAAGVRRVCGISRAALPPPSAGARGVLVGALVAAGARRMRPEGGSVSEQLLTKGASSVWAPTPTGIRNPTDEELIAIILASRRKRR